MVAYSFKAQFEKPIAALDKRQTVRGDRKRHARPGEALQLFVGMRTKHCRKILTPDPICLDARHIAIEFDLAGSNWITSIEIDGIGLDDDEIEAFALADGFEGKGLFTARQRMGAFWRLHHGGQSFEGVVIRWEPR